MKSEGAEVSLENTGRDSREDHINLVIPPCSCDCVLACMLFATFYFDCHIHSGLAADQTSKIQ